MTLPRLLPRLACIACAIFVVSLSFRSLSAQQIDSIKKKWGDPNGELRNLPTYPVKRGATIYSENVLTPHSQENMYDWWLVSYQTDVDTPNNWEIYVANQHGDNRRRLTTNQGLDVMPALNHDASKLIFVSDRDGNAEIYLMDSDGANQVRLTFDPATDTQPTWSPDGQKIVFVSTRDGNADLYLMNSDGTGQTKLTTSSLNELYPDWSPDGQSLIWIQVQDDTNGQVWIMQSDGSNQRALTGALRYVQHPVWSKNGQEIAIDYDADNDNLNELVVLETSDLSSRVVLDGGAPPRPQISDLWINEWSLDNTGVDYSTYTYSLDASTGKYYLGALNIGTVCITNSCGAGIYPIGGALNSSTKTRDPYPPITNIVQLPRYTRGFGTNLQWIVNEIGPSGYSTAEVQYRTEVDPDWKHFVVGYNTSEYICCSTNVGFAIDVQSLVPGAARVYFRARSRDIAENVEPWSEAADGTTSTTFFQHQLEGRITDIRGKPIVKQNLYILPVAVEPVETDDNGNFIARLFGDGEYLIGNGTRRLIRSDDYVTIYQEEENLIANGDFEVSTSPESWNAQGNFQVISDMQNVNSGSQAIVLGQRCNGLCLEPLPTEELTSTIYGVNDGYVSDLVVLPEASKGLHIIGLDSRESGLYYTFFDFQLGWSKKEQISAESPTYYHAVLDKHNDLHVVWPTASVSSPIHYRTRSKSGTWTSAQEIGIGLRPKIAINDVGTIFVAFEECVEASCAMRLSKNNSNGGWNLLPKFGFFDEQDYSLVVTNDGTAHLTWQGAFDTSGNHAIYTIRRPDGSLIHQIDLADKWAYRSYLFLARDQTFYAFWKSGNLDFIEKPYNGKWSEPNAMPAEFASRVKMDSNDILHFDGGRHQNPDLSFQPEKYRFHLPKGGWSAGVSLSGSETQDLVLLAVSDNILYLAPVGGPLYRTQPAPEAVDSSIVQTVTIPANMNKPTLAFIYQTLGGGENSRFTVNVSDSISSTELFSKTNFNLSSLGWADLSQWQGRPITLTFTNHQEVNEAQFLTFLDHISLGSWSTPDPQSLLPNQVDFGVAATVTIRGTNFIAAPFVYVGELQISDVRWINESTIRVTLPNTMAEGVYDVKVVNPSGQSAFLFGALKVGTQIYLPLVAR